MKFKTKIVTLSILIILIFPSIIEIWHYGNFKTNETKEKNKFQIKQSGFWNLTESPIYIDDVNPNFSWSKTATENMWCNGLGTWNEPYIIENITINGLGSNDCIYINNSKAHFIIRNCTLYNAGGGSYPNYDSGIYLVNSSMVN
jgi:hypothetical protein